MGLGHGLRPTEFRRAPWRKPGISSKKIWCPLAAVKVMKVVTLGKSIQFSEAMFPHL